MRETIVCLLLAAGILPAQTFEVASIKRAAPVGGPVKGDPEGSVSISPGNLTMRNVTLKDMITAAYSIKDHQLSAPAWLKSDRYDVVAKSDAPATADRIKLMLQGLLAERFKLEIHRESRDLAVAAMIVAKNGPKLGKAKPEGQSAIGIDGGKMTFQNYSMSKLADYLSQRSAGRPVVDETAIAGFYDFSVPLLDAPSDNPADVKRALGMAMRDGSFARMVAEEIGLKLQPRTGPVEIIVVDHAEKSPTEN
jgi:uncharacterized protein (TIGR03435 family)